MIGILGLLAIFALGLVWWKGKPWLEAFLSRKLGAEVSIEKLFVGWGHAGLEGFRLLGGRGDALHTRVDVGHLGLELAWGRVIRGDLEGLREVNLDGVSVQVDTTDPNFDRWLSSLSSGGGGEDSRIFPRSPICDAGLTGWVLPRRLAGWGRPGHW